MRFSLSVLGKTGVYCRWKRQEEKKERKKGKKKALHDLKGKGERIVVDRRRVYETRRSVFRVRVTDFSPFFEPLDIYRRSRVSLWTNWGGNFRKSLEVNFLLEMQIGSWPFRIGFFQICFFFPPNFDHFKNIFLFFLKFNRSLEYRECPRARIDRAIMRMIGETR